MNRLRALTLMTLVLAVSWTASVHAQDPPTGPPDVFIKLQPQGADQPRELRIGPRGVGLCPGKRGCGDTVTFIWVGNANQSEEIRITFDDEVQATACFGATGVTLTGTGSGNSESLTVKDSCTGKRALFYTVACQGGAGNDCEGVVPVDPGMIIDGGRS